MAKWHGMTRICCGVVVCKYRKIEPQYVEGKNGYCTARQIFLKPCAHDADNIVACSEFTERDDTDNAETKTKGGCE